MIKSAVRKMCCRQGDKPTFVGIDAREGLHEQVGATAGNMHERAFFAEQEAGGDGQTLACGQYVGEAQDKEGGWQVPSPRIS